MISLDPLRSGNSQLKLSGTVLTRIIERNRDVSPVDPIFRARIPLPSLLVALLMADWLVQEPP